MIRPLTLHKRSRGTSLSHEPCSCQSSSRRRVPGVRPATPSLRTWKKGQQGRRGCSINTGSPPPCSPSLQPGSVVFFLGGGVGPSFKMHHVQSYFLWRWRPHSRLCTDEARSRGVSALPAPFQESPTLTPACKGREDHPSHRPSSPPQRAQGGASKPQDCSKEKMN